MKKSDSIKDLAAALAKAQGTIKPAAKDSVNPFFKSAYANLTSVWEAIREPLAKNGLAVMQFPSVAAGIVSVETVLAHASGEWISETLTATPAKSDVQSLGSVVTYLRRYWLSAIVGVVADDDDDGNAAASDSRPATRPEQTQHSAPQKPPEPQQPVASVYEKAKAFIAAAKNEEQLGEAILKCGGHLSAGRLTEDQCNELAFDVGDRRAQLKGAI